MKEETTSAETQLTGPERIWIQSYDKYAGTFGYFYFSTESFAITNPPVEYVRADLTRVNESLVTALQSFISSKPRIRFDDLCYAHCCRKAASRSRTCPRRRNQMTTRADYLHRLIFGNHFHPCPSEDCKGAERSCSDDMDCQPGPKLCQGCYLVQEREQFIARGHSEKCGGWECADDCGAVALLRAIMAQTT